MNTIWGSGFSRISLYEGKEWSYIYDGANSTVKGNMRLLNVLSVLFK